jgi:hypothetical protein
MAQGKNKAFEEKRGKGRPKGAINKITLAFRESLDLKGFDLVERLLDLYHSGEFDAKEQARIIFRMMEYAFPKLKEREVTIDGEVVDPPTPINISLQELINVARGNEN